MPEGTPALGVPRIPEGTPAHGVPRVRGGHPEQREDGGGWGGRSGRRTGAAHGAPTGAAAAARPGGAEQREFPRQRQAPPGGPRQGLPGAPQQNFPGEPRQGFPGGPRQEYLDAFQEDEDVFASRTAPRPPSAGYPPAGYPSSGHTADPYASATDWNAAGAVQGRDGAPPAAGARPARSGKGRTFTGIAAAAVTTVLAVIVAGQVTDGRDTGDVRSQSAADRARDTRDPASRTDERPTPSSSAAAAPLTYEQKMDKKYPLSATLEGSGTFDAVPGVDKAPGRGQKYTYRVDVEQGLGLDAGLFAQAVQKTLNDDRSWAHNGARTFERVYSGQPDFVITLASPGTTADWCAKSGLDTTVDNVSCDSAATERVMINAYRWAQGSPTYGDQIHAYRQMLINHEVGHRLGHSHVTCDKDGELAPVMQQQTKFLDHDGIHCRANPWPYPGT